MTNLLIPTPRSVINYLNPYVPGLSDDAVRRIYEVKGEIIKLNSNENPLGTSPNAIESLKQHLDSGLNIYPDPNEFIEKISKKHSVNSEMVILGNGSNDILDIIARTYLDPGDDSISSEYGFLVYNLSTQLCGANNVIVPAKSYGHDLAGFLKSINKKTKVIWIANPNNPTGTFLSGESIVNFLNQVPKNIVVVLDEAYTEYINDEDKYDSIDYLEEFKNLIVVRTLSKIYGLAGLRLGYAISDRDITKNLHRVRQPFNVNSMALIAGMAAVDDEEFINKSRKYNFDGMKQLEDGFVNLGLKFISSYGNFITVEFPNAKLVYEELIKREGIIIRPLNNYNMNNFLRITVGSEDQNIKLLNGIKECMK